MTDEHAHQDPVQEPYSGLCNANQLFMGFIASKVDECKTATISDIGGKITAATTTINTSTATKVVEKLKPLTTDVASIKSATTSITTAVNAIKLEPLKLDVTAIKSVITNETTGFAPLSTAVNQIKSEVSAIKSATNANKDRITALSQKIDAVLKEIRPAEPVDQAFIDEIKAGGRIRFFWEDHSLVISALTTVRGISFWKTTTERQADNENLLVVIMPGSEEHLRGSKSDEIDVLLVHDMAN
eukprot:215087_1